MTGLNVQWYITADIMDIGGKIVVDIIPDDADTAVYMKSSKNRECGTDPVEIKKIDLLQK